MEPMEEGGEEAAPMSTSKPGIKGALQSFLDRSVIHPYIRWLFLAFALSVYALRVYFAHGYYIVTYALAIFLLNMFLGFISPKEDFDGNPLPQSVEDEEEYRPFSRKVPEFVLWFNCAKATLIAFGCSLFPFFDIPAYWPILVIYFLILSFATLKERLVHMIQHGYVPWSKKKTIYPGDEAMPKEKAAPRDHKD